jgi:hypothetical protein
MSFNRTLFNEFVATLGLSFFSASELLSQQYVPTNGPPPMRLWHNIVPTILILEEVRRRLGSPVKIVSAYRTEAYNNNGSPGRVALSQHQAYTAIDFQVPGHSVEKIAKELEWWQDSLWFRSPIDFQRKPEKVKAGAIRFGELPRAVFSKGGGFSHVMFQLRGFIKPYTSKTTNFIHLDTRGIRDSSD